MNPRDYDQRREFEYGDESRYGGRRRYGPGDHAQGRESQMGEAYGGGSRMRGAERWGDGQDDEVAGHCLPCCRTDAAAGASLKATRRPADTSRVQYRGGRRPAGADAAEKEAGGMATNLCGRRVRTARSGGTPPAEPERDP